MRALSLLAAAVLLSLSLAAGAARASEDGSLFVNMTSDDVHRADMAFAFSKAQMERGHPVTIWLNDKGVFLADTDNADRAGAAQAKLKALVTGGAQVIVCPMCMQHYGVKESTLLDGVQIGKPDVTGAALFAEDAKTLSW